MSSEQPLKSILVGTNLQQVRKPNPDEKAIKCPKCNSSNTKFCYYNNYTLSQPRYFCKSCRKYWTGAGKLRNVKVGEGSRKNKRSSSSSSSPTPASLDFVKIQLQQRKEQMGFDDHKFSMLGNNKNNNPSVNLSSFSSVLETAAGIQNNFYSGNMVDTNGKIGNLDNGGMEINNVGEDFEAAEGMSCEDERTASSTTAISSSTATT